MFVEQRQNDNSDYDSNISAYKSSSNGNQFHKLTTHITTKSTLVLVYHVKYTFPFSVFTQNNYTEI